MAPLPTVPPCKRLGAQCRSIDATLRIGSLDEGAASLDHESTWLLGHTQHITFGVLWEGDGELYTEATLHVPCRYLRREGTGARCLAWGFVGSLPAGPQRVTQPRQLGGDRFVVVDRRRPVTRRLTPEPPVPASPSPGARALPVIAASEEGNPCAGAPCRTADHRRGAACCRDLQIEIMCTPAQHRLEALVRSRRSPYLCKVSRPGEFSLEAEVISACGYLETGGVACTLHGRRRADGRAAKPDLCSDWPPRNKGLHPGCVFGPRKSRKAAR